MSQDFNFVLAGFGGQGLLFGGKVIATAGLDRGQRAQLAALLRP